MATNAPQPERVTGVQLMQGIGHAPARGFWADAWSQVVKRPAAVAALLWLAIVAFFAVYAPVIASGHPLWLRPVDPAGAGYSPLWRQLAPLDVLLLGWVTLALPYVLLGSAKARSRRLGAALGGLIAAIAILAITGVVQGRLEGAATDLDAQLRTIALRTGRAQEAPDHFVRRAYAGYVLGGITSAAVLGLLAAIPLGKPRRRITVAALAAVAATLSLGLRWEQPLERFEYEAKERAGKVVSTYTLIPWSPFQRFSDLSRNEPGASRWRAVIASATQALPAQGPVSPESLKSLRAPLDLSLEQAPPAQRQAALARLDALIASTPVDRDRVRRELDGALGPKFHMGTDKDGADVLTQLLHACRLSISIGLVSTGVALMIGVTFGALMGYFGGWIDLGLYRIVEIFMAVPVLFLLIVAVAVLPEDLKTTYVIMAIIGCFTWTGMARYTRAEFLKLRNQDFVQAAKAVGLPLRSILFKHMLPNGVAPVLVDTSFAIASAISLEAILSYLGLGPADSASWGKLLSSAISSDGEFKWWLAVFPGLAIFFTVLSYNLLGESLRDAIDPKLKKARV